MNESRDLPHAAPRTAAELADALRDARQYTESTYAHLSEADLAFPRLAIVNPPRWEIGHIGWFDFHRAREAIEIGARTTERALEQIDEAIAALSPPPEK